MSLSLALSLARSHYLSLALSCTLALALLASSLVSIPANPAVVLAAVLSYVFLSVWSVSASEELSRITVVQNLLVQLIDMIK